MAENTPLSSPQLRCGDRVLDLSSPQIMAVLNVTPDSFSDGGQYFVNGRPNLDLVLSQVERFVEEGATIIDVGGESTRPGAAQVAAEEEVARVLPVVQAIAARFDVVISVDTSSADVIRGAAGAGAGMLNDVRALRRDGALAAAAQSGLPVCLMHMQGEPDTMQAAPQYRDIYPEVEGFLLQRIGACRAAGIGSERLVLDPGFGFGKTVEHNLRLFAQLPELVALGYPVLVGVSRKSMIGTITGREVGQRLAGSVAMAAMAIERGASIIRVHDVKETADAIAVATALLRESGRHD